jgi:two-component system chemotaxis response regulator CheB
MLPGVPELRSADPEIPSYVVIGTSAGGVEALTQIFKDLPAVFPGALLVVFHTGASSRVEWLAERLTRTGQLSVTVAQDGEPIR